VSLVTVNGIGGKKNKTKNVQLGQLDFYSTLKPEKLLRRVGEVL